MKGLSWLRSKKQRTPTGSTPASPPPTPQGPSRAPRSLAWLPTVFCALAGLACAGGLLWLDQQQQQNQLTALNNQRLSQLYSSSLNQAYEQLLRETQRAAHSDLLDALRSKDSDLIAISEQQLTERDGVVDAYISLSDQASVQPQRKAPITFAALDLIQRAQDNKSPAPEAYRSGNVWLLYSAAPIKNTQGHTQGVLLLAYDLNRLTRLLPNPDSNGGQLRLVQQFAGAPAQPLWQQGDSGSDTVMALTSPSPHWQWSWQLPTPSQSLSLFWPLAALLSIVGLLGGLWVYQRLQQHSLREDVDRLIRWGGGDVPPPTLRHCALQPLLERLRQPSVKAQAVATPAAPMVVPEPALATTEIFDLADIAQEFVLPDEILEVSAPTKVAPMNDIPVIVEETQAAPDIDAGLFRAYDIRGIVGSNLTLDAAYWIGRAFGSQAIDQNQRTVVVGRDGRLSSPTLAEALIRGLVESGCYVKDIGMVPTPVLYFATYHLEAGTGVMITGSHNPPQYNGFKMMIDGDTLATDQITALYERIVEQRLHYGAGGYEQVAILDAYRQRITSDVKLAKPLRLVIDCGNGVGGVIAKHLFEELGCHVTSLYDEVDGNFPNHHPDPSKAENLADLIAAVKAQKADAGLAFDGDADRGAVVSNDGDAVFADHMLMLFAKDVVTRNPGTEVLYDVKCTRRLSALISGYGGRPTMWKTGHSLMKKKMRETGALLGGEMSGHVFIKERWYGFDDGLYTGARFLELLSKDQRTASQIFAAFPVDPSTPEIQVTVTEDRKFSIIDDLQKKASWGRAQVSSLDGVRVDYPDGWGLVRASNTTPILVLRFEGKNAEALETIQQKFREQLLAVAPDLNLPF